MRCVGIPRNITLKKTEIQSGGDREPSFIPIPKTGYLISMYVYMHIEPPVIEIFVKKIEQNLPNYITSPVIRIRSLRRVLSLHVNMFDLYLLVFIVCV